MIKAVIGLGNPGKQYEKTRHNIGFMVADAVVSHLKCSKKYIEKSFSHIYECHDHDVIVAKPQTYMNNSGIAVKNLIEDYKLSPDEILVIYDDLDLPLGTVKLRKKGSSGGHRGLQSIIQELKTESFPRLRIGIGRPERKEQVVEYVLSSFDKKEQLLVEKIIQHGAQCVLNVLKYGIDKSMNFCNQKIV
ncbi:aminoacyl-tRNA hydrolase [Persephonella atlantica]|uniref:Peptidyl-tRNA hydrolase n=1 Tax=Persephonella atlantica TaxID=2699429 RepID=A0ABS1GHC6_9AQUI|nr:aminoacyl-tRNA hydrolase [Persephonella atlantica]MBK3332317.1 aminoacyl-tRNA hydrolase [Persephonella atlantica]